MAYRFLLAACTSLLTALLASTHLYADSSASYEGCLSAYEDRDWGRTIEECGEVAESGQVSDAETVEALIRRCWARRENGDLETALVDCDVALEIDPEHPEAYNVRGAVYNAMNEPDRAIEDFDRALRLAPDFAVAYNNRGNAYDAKGEHDRAIQDFDQALRFNPDYVHAYNNRGNTYEGMGQYIRAIEDFDRALRLAPDFAIAYNNRGTVRFYLGSFAESAKDLEAAIDRGIGSEYSFLWLFLARERTGLDGSEILKAQFPKLNMDRWPGPIIGYLQGTVSDEELRRTVERSSPKLRARKECEYNFFVGEIELLKERVARARELLERAAADCAPTTIEQRGAKAELARLPQ